jgi:glutamine synthetase
MLPAMFEVATLEDAERVLKETDAEFVTVGIVDTQGMLRGKYVSRRKFASALRDGMGVPAVTLGLDFHDVMAANATVGGPDTGYFDALVRVIPESCRVIPWEPQGRNLFFQLEYVDDTAAVCTRNVLHRVLARAHALGIAPVTGLEYEFTLFRETSDSVVAKGHRDLQVATPHSTYYVLQRQSAWAEFYGAIMDACRSLGVSLDSMHEEMGPGFMEATIAYGAPLRVADDAVVFKSYAKAVAHRRDLLLSFMARWSNEADGQSGHLHLSLRDLDDKPLLHDADGPSGLSTTMLHMLGGLQQLMPELLLMLAPNVNSFKRLVPGIFAPIASFWGVENRSCALRAIPGGPGGTRVECRTPGADANPYLVTAALVGAALYGVEHEIQPELPLQRDAYATEVPEHLAFPASFRDGIDRYRASTVARELFGDRFVDHFADTREWQEREFRALVTDRELERFFELA